MPTYICRAPEGLLAPMSKAALAECITDIHAEVTGGRRAFAQVIFRGTHQDDCYIGGKVLEGPHCIIQGHIRAGRSAIERSAIIRALLPKRDRTIARLQHRMNRGESARRRAGSDRPAKRARRLHHRPQAAR